MITKEAVTLTRDCEGIELSSSHKVNLVAGSQVTVTQSSPESITVKTASGELVRVAASDADALNENGQAAPAGASQEDLEKQVWEQLRSCYDPEIPLNIVDLGLIYSCQVAPVPEGGHRVDVTMTLTAPGCGMGEYLKMEVQAKVSTVPGVTAANVEVVFDPPWSDALLTDAAKLKLGLL